MNTVNNFMNETQNILDINSGPQKSKSHLENLIKEETARAFKEGFKEGEISGYEKSQNEMDILINIFKKVVNNLLEKTTTLKTDIQSELITFCIRLCEKILLKRLTTISGLTETVSNVISKHLECFPKSVKVFLSPKDLKKLNDWARRNDCHLPLNVTWSSEESLNEGSFKINTPDSLIFYDIPTEIDNLLNHLEL